MKSGFTIVELLVVVGITTLLAGIIITYTSTGRGQVALFIEEAEIAQTISRAKALSVSTYNQPDVPCGYGVYFDYTAETYDLFSYDIPDCDDIETSGIDPSQRTIITNSSLSEFLALNDEPSDSVSHVFFIPPDPDTLIWRLSGTPITDSGTIYLKTQDESAAAEIKINTAGQISF